MTTFRGMIVSFVAASSFVLHPSSFAMADGGEVRVSEQTGAYHVTVFTSPVPFRAGPVDVSVMVLDAATGEHAADTRVTVRLTARETGLARDHPATPEAATNKLLRAAVFELPGPGWWDVEVTVEGPHGPAVLRFGVEAGEPPPRWLELWPWFAWPALAVALFGLHRALVRGKGRTAGGGP